MLLIYAINRNDRAVNNKQSVSSSFQPAKRRLDARRWATCFQFNVGHPIRQLVIVYFHHVQSWTSPPTPLPPLHLRFPQILDLGDFACGRKGKNWCWGSSNDNPLEKKWKNCFGEQESMRRMIGCWGHEFPGPPGCLASGIHHRLISHDQFYPFWIVWRFQRSWYEPRWATLFNLFSAWTLAQILPLKKSWLCLMSRRRRSCFFFPFLKTACVFITRRILVLVLRF